MSQQMSSASQPESAAVNYQRQAVLSMSPGELVVKAYDIGIQACRQGDGDRACRVLIELISALRFDQQELATGLFRLYQYALGKVKAKDFESACEVLLPLRDAWHEAAAAPAN